MPTIKKFGYNQSLATYNMWNAIWSSTSSNVNHSMLNETNIFGVGNNITVQGLGSIAELKCDSTITMNNDLLNGNNFVPNWEIIDEEGVTAFVNGELRCTGGSVECRVSYTPKLQENAIYNITFTFTNAGSVCDGNKISIAGVYNTFGNTAGTFSYLRYIPTGGSKFLVFLLNAEFMGTTDCRITSVTVKKVGGFSHIDYLELGQSLLLQTDNTVDLGSASLRFNDIFFGGDITGTAFSTLGAITLFGDIYPTNVISNAMETTNGGVTTFKANSTGAFSLGNITISKLLRLEVNTQPLCNSAINGSIIRNQTNCLTYCNGVAWKQITC